MVDNQGREGVRFAAQGLHSPMLAATFAAVPRVLLHSHAVALSFMGEA